MPERIVHALEVLDENQASELDRLVKDRDAIAEELIESRIIFCQSRQREDCFQKAVIKRGLRRIRRKALRARWSSSQ